MDEITILLVEDSRGDARLILEAFKDSPLKMNVHIAEDGVIAMCFLRRDGKYAESPRPDIILITIAEQLEIERDL